MIAAGAFVWGILAGNYKVFPWSTIQPLGEQVAVYLRSLGLFFPIEPSQPARITSVVHTGLVNFDMTIVNNGAPVPGHGGAVAVTDGGILIGRRIDGMIDFYDTASETLRTLAITLPPLRFDTIPKRFESGRQANPWHIRYNDIEVVRLADGDHLFTTYNRYDPDRVCFTFRLDEAKLPDGWRDGTEPVRLDWRMVHEAEPCLPPALDRNTSGGNQAGGRIVPAPDGSILVTSGDYEWDGVGRKSPGVSQGDDSDYGRVLRLDPTTWAITEVSRGHRNPQGLAIDGSGRIWMAEQGPMGGDELNIIEPGRNYGWPLVTLGIFYNFTGNDRRLWPGNPRQGRHDGFEPPQFAWMPSVATSSMAFAEGIPRWEGDLIVTALIGQSLRRLRIEGDHVLYDEPIPMPERVRDIAITGGRIYVLLDDGRFIVLVPHDMQDTDPDLGRTTTALFDHGCIECHANAAAPSLAHVMDNDIAAQAGIQYSEALRRAEGTWTAERLAAFLASPSTFAPGTTMPDPGLDEGAIETLISEIRSLRQQPN